MRAAGKRSRRSSTMLRGSMRALEEFVERDLMIHLDNRYLSLALPENPYLLDLGYICVTG